ncbi:MAG: hypothetical protein IJ315_04065, partial [Firmicutes bacterium]|nr:hypothetical protein [Bacillota bacterium]
MKFRWDKKYLHWGITAFCVIAASICFYLMLSQLEAFKGFLGLLVRVTKPVIYGLVFAYLMNPILRVMERPIFYQWGLKLKKDERKAASFARGIGVFLTLLVTLIFLAVLIWMVLPRLYESIEMLISNTPTYFNMGREFIIKTFPDGSDIETFFLNVLDSVSRALSDWLNGDFLSELGALILSISTGIYALAKELLNILVGFIVSVYVLTG